MAAFVVSRHLLKCYPVTQPTGPKPVLETPIHRQVVSLESPYTFVQVRLTLARRRCRATLEQIIDEVCQVSDVYWPTYSYNPVSIAFFFTRWCWTAFEKVVNQIGQVGYVDWSTDTDNTIDIPSILAAGARIGEAVRVITLILAPQSVTADRIGENTTFIRQTTCSYQRRSFLWWQHAVIN